MAAGKINLAFLWHMHQPPYEDPRTGIFILPWTWLHATKDYLDMGDLVRRHPGIHVNFNFTPCLLQQLEQYAEGTVRDQTLDVMCRNPADLTEQDREFLVRTCLMACPPAFVERFPRYRQLLDFFRASGKPDRAAASFGSDDLVDLTTLFLMSWCGPVLSLDPTVRELAGRGSGYQAADRDALVSVGREFIKGIVPLYRDLADSGRVELSTSPFYHPLSPLLWSSSAALEADPSVTLPGVRFEVPDELERQIRHGLDYFERVVGIRPAGMWPPEGAVSEQVVHAMGERGMTWLASDGEILRRSLGGRVSRSESFHPHRFDGVSLFFRNQVLSDHIGFVYSRWPMAQSVDHFMKTLEGLAADADSDDALVSVILDGENAWEFYPDGGYPFLDALYQAVEESDFVESVTFSDYLDRFGPGEELDQLATGSWIDGNLNTWIGDPVKNRAWEYLTSAYQAARDVPGALCLSDEGSGVDHALKCCLMRAEASDWFWWFGKGHDSVHEREFDYLFRQNLSMIYKELHLTTPDHLSRPVDLGQGPVPVAPPTAYISPVINGRNDGFYKWVGAGTCEFSHGSIHRQKPLVSSVSFGFDQGHVYFRVAGFEPMGDSLSNDGWLKIHFARPSECVVWVRFDGDHAVLQTTKAPIPGARAAVDEVVEICLPVDFLLPSANETQIHRLHRDSTVDLGETGSIAIEFCVVLGEGDLELERFPWDSVIAMEFDPVAFEVDNWFV
ncbi:MAG: hypothetical protein ISR64_03055 [Deltaproteobacteria bacterium]|nr:hypothetical protein [Deltaproteobacteria bacterium]